MSSQGGDGAALGSTSEAQQLKVTGWVGGGVWGGGGQGGDGAALGSTPSEAHHPRAPGRARCVCVWGGIAQQLRPRAKTTALNGGGNPARGALLGGQLQRAGPHNIF
jgi:hypothetical protein